MSVFCSRSTDVLFIQEAKWDQETFERLLVEWMVACDQPFEEVNQPEFRRLLEYTHLRQSLHIPHRQSVKRRVMKMGEDTVEEVKKMIEELDCKVSVSLDGWTSSNQYGFLAIVMHYITKAWQLSEYLPPNLIFHVFHAKLHR